jgi:hypothetical protein
VRGRESEGGRERERQKRERERERERELVRHMIVDKSLTIKFNDHERLEIRSAAVQHKSDKPVEA